MQLSAPLGAGAAVLVLLGLHSPVAAQGPVSPRAPGSSPAPSPAPTSLPTSAPSSAPSSQPAPPAPPPAAADDDLAELQRALAADAAAGSPRVAAGPDAAAPAQPAPSLQSMNPDISFIADVAGAYFSGDDPLMVGGHDPTDTGFHLQQLELYVSGAVDAYFRFDANLVFSQFGVEIEEVYATSLSLPWNLQLRAGQFLTAFGRINATHPHTWDFVDQTLVLGKMFGGEGNRGLGAELSLLLPLPWYVLVLGSVTDATGAATARSFWGAEDVDLEGVDDFQSTVALKQFFALSDNWSLMWGLSAALGPNPSGRDNRTDILGTDLYLKFRPITHGSYTQVALQAEWLLRRRQLPGRVAQDHGLYASLLWRFAKRWAAAVRYEYISGVDDDPLDPQWTELRQRVSGNLTFWPTEFSRLRLQYNYDRPGWRDAYHGVLLAFEFAVGAHGAHKF